MTLKDINFSVDMYGTSAITANTYQTVFTGDEDSVQLKFSVTDEEDLTGATALIHLYFGDSSHIERVCTPITGGFQYTLTGTENDHAGITRVDIYITKAGAKFTRAGYKFRIDKSLEASAPLVEYAVDTVDTVVKEAGDWILQAQTDFGTAQGTRAAEWVADNDTRADDFNAAQTSQANSFSASEAARTSTFNANETGRSNTFTVNENARQEAAEANQAQAATDHSTALTDHSTAVADSSMASSDHATATTDHNTAVTDHSTANADHAAALADQEIVDGLQDQFNDVIANVTVDSEVINARQGSATLSQNILSIKGQLADTLNKSAITLTHMFADNTARDAYFVAHPTELLDLQFIKVGTGYQQYIEGTWQASTAIVAEQLSATNQPIVDTGNYFTTDNTNAALQEMGAHKASTANPHGVTKTQVGLGNVDNTSDANKPVSTAGQTALNLKADKTTTDVINTRLTAEETATANNKISAVKGKTFADVDARFEDVEADTAMMGTNLVANGDFANGLNDSIPYDAMISVLNGELTLLATAMHGNVRKMFNVVNGNKYYIKTMVKATTNSVNINIAGVYGTKSHTGSGAYETLSSIWTSITTATFNMRVQDTRVSGWDNVYVKYMLALDLTATFGAGNEPTAAQMDRLLTLFPNSWFDGTENLFLAKWALGELRRLDNEKANKVQEAWITPTLVNSWVAFDTQTAKYKKADYGRVYLKGLVKNGTIGATIFTLPTGYRPDEALIFGVITVNVNGTVVCTSGVNTSVSLSGVNFFV